MKIQGLLGRGMLPSQISPAFSSEGFSSIGPSLRGKVSTPTQGYAVTRHNSARPGGLRRRLEIPNPFAYLEVADLCSANWNRLRSLAARSPVSATRPLLDTRGTRSIAYLSDLRVLDPRISERMRGAKFTLHTDISSFYDSIYTHALDWAIQGKDAAKCNFARKKPRATLGRRVDQALQRARSRQTSGISVGPDASLLVSEVLLASVDKQLAERMPRFAAHGYRFVDDLVFYASSQGEAETLLGEWQTILAEYELSANPTKTRIVEGPSPIRETWVARMAQARLRDSTDRAYCADLEDLFSLAFELRREHPGQGVLAYAIKRANPFPLGKQSWPLFVDFILSCAILEPSVLRHVHDVVEFGTVRGMRIDQDAFEEALHVIVAEHAPFDHGSEVAWALTLLRQLKLPVATDLGSTVATMTDNASLLLLRDMHASGLVDGSPDFTAAEARCQGAEALVGPDWLLAYESARLGYISDWHVRRSPGWRDLRKADVAFFLSRSAQRRTRLKRRRPSFVTT